ncbi:MAG: hypothetical protein ABW185_07485 [Sedimenticola sp.]
MNRSLYVHSSIPAAVRPEKVTAPTWKLLICTGLLIRYVKTEGLSVYSEFFGVPLKKTGF